MTSDTIPACPLALTTVELSAWLDGTLPPAAAARLDEHLAQCLACQQRCDAYRAIAMGLRAMTVPEPIGGYGRNPRPRADADRSRVPAAAQQVATLRRAPVRPRQPQQVRPLRRLRVGGGLAALAAALLLALAFAQVFHEFAGRAAMTATPAPALATAGPAFATATPAVPAVGALIWQTRTLAVAPPAPELASFHTPPTVAFAQSDASIAYECVNPPGDTIAQVWLTRDGAAHWQRMGDLRTTQVVDACTITVDTTNPAIAVAETFYSPPGNCGDCFLGIWTDFVTFDYGAHWVSRASATSTSGSQAVTTGDSAFPVVSLTSYQGAIYALHVAHPIHSGNAEYALLVSHDAMRSWTRIDQHLPTAGVRAFWLNPANGAMLVMSNPTHSLPFGMQVWSSDDGGAHWHLIPYPFGANVVVQSPFAAQPWHLCVWDTSAWSLPGNGVNTTNTHAQDLACSGDGGATWTTHHITNLARYDIVGIADDGAALLADLQIYRLVPGQVGLQALGPLPADVRSQGSARYVAAAGKGMLWVGPFGPTIDGTAVLNQPGTLSTAAYA